MKRSVVLSLVFVLVLAFAGVGLVLAKHYKPELGLDLQGGAYVVLQPKNKVSSGVLQQSVSIIRQRVDALGVAEPDISTQGSSIIVQLPGVKDQQRALSIVGQTAELRFRPVLQAGIPPTSATSSTTTTTAQGATTTTPGSETGTTTPAPTTTTIPGVTPREQDLPDATVVLPEMKNGQPTQLYQLGPAKATGRIVKSATAQAPQGLGADWSVGINLTGDGNTLFNQLAAACYDKTPECPTGQLAIVLDGIVKSAPAVQARQFTGTVQITGTFTQSEANDLALVLKYGSLPVELIPQSTQTVSATIGKDSLRAGVIAGLLGLALVVLYMVLYYRALGLVVIIGLGVSGALLWTLLAVLGSTRGLALTLSGAVGIIVSVGITADSYIVYFERLKDEIRSGKTIRSSVDRAFTRAYRTTVAADLSSLIGAAVLYFLTVGSVRGFAFFLGVSALLDLFVAYFFTRPMVILLGRNRFFTEAPFFGVARGLAATEATA